MVFGSVNQTGFRIIGVSITARKFIYAAAIASRVIAAIDIITTDRTTDATEALEVFSAVRILFATVDGNADSADASISLRAAVRRAIGEVRSFREAMSVEALEAFWAGLSITTGLSTSTKDTLVSRWAGVFSCDRRIGRTRSFNREAEESNI